MKKVLTSLYTTALILFVSCNSAENKKAEEAPVTLAAASFKVMMIKHPVADFDAWKTVFLAHDSIRQAYGISSYAIGRNMDDPNQLIVIDKIADMQKAKEFGAMPELKDAMDKAGVTGPPSFDYADVMRNDDSKIDAKDRLMIKHRVKDFDAWLKVFDGEGMKTRSENGLIDRGLARGADDPNIVYIVFAISDMAKAKARVGSEELKSKMMEAGVEGPPEFFYFTLAN